MLVLLPPPEAGHEAPVGVQKVPLVARAPQGDRMMALAIPSHGEELMRCAHYSCTMAAYHCLQRQRTARDYSNGKAHFKYTPPHLEHCASGKCEQGGLVALALRGQPVPEVPEKRRSRYELVGKRLDGLVSRDRSRWKKAVR
jgi:hypothetical protein